MVDHNYCHLYRVNYTCTYIFLSSSPPPLTMCSNPRWPDARDSKGLVNYLISNPGSIALDTNGVNDTDI